VQTYLGHAVAGRHEQAIEHVLGLLERGTTVTEVLLDVVAPAQYELGRLWERGVVDVAQEHVATAVTQITMSSLHPLLVAEPRLDDTLVAAAAPGDLHEVGLRIVTDLLQLHGWDTQYVGASCPVADVVEAVVTSEASLLLLGASMTAHLPALRTAIEQVRADPRCEDLTVLVGGDPFRHVPGLATWTGADLVATSARGAVEAAAGVVEAQEATGV
jgi:methanogenic corrinoid protein MtbC1